jgi:hypothetical protein
VILIFFLISVSMREEFKAFEEASERRGPER